MTTAISKFVLTVHVASSVGWLGAAASFLALALTGLTSMDVNLVQGAYLAMAVTGWSVVVPLALASLLSGLILSLGTRWGLFRHYWIVIKLLITLVSVLIVVGFTPTLSLLRTLGADTTLSLGDLRHLGQSPVVHSAGGLLALLVTTGLSAYKPRGVTPYGQRKQRETYVQRKRSERKPS